jgi:hypothetical protein
MSRYYFDMRHEDEIASDEEGVKLPTIESVQEEAAARSRTWRATLCGLIATGHERPMAIEVRDDSGPVLQAWFTFEVERQWN